MSNPVAAKPVVNFLDIKTVQRVLNQYPLKLDYKNKEHVDGFKKLLEWSLTQGRWAGFMAEVS